MTGSGCPPRSPSGSSCITYWTFIITNCCRRECPSACIAWTSEPSGRRRWGKRTNRGMNKRGCELLRGKGGRDGVEQEQTGTRVETGHWIQDTGNGRRKTQIQG